MLLAGGRRGRGLHAILRAFGSGLLPGPSEEESEDGINDVIMDSRFFNSFSQAGTASSSPAPSPSARTTTAGGQENRCEMRFLRKKSHCANFWLIFFSFFSR